VALLRAALAVLASVAVALATVDAGDPLPALRLMDWRGQPLALADLRGRVLCVELWATWCEPCREALPALDALARRHPGVAVVAVNVDADRTRAERFLAERLPAPALTLAADPDGALAARLGAPGMPTLWVVDRAGTVRLVASGWTPERRAQVDALVERLVADPDSGR
jgi:cytochrome c biogenesis protein CcmG, thiol:disulfide interchange protein DsbE